MNGLSTCACCGKHHCEPGTYPTSLADTWVCECGKKFRAVDPHVERTLPDRVLSRLPVGSLGWTTQKRSLVSHMGDFDEENGYGPQLATADDVIASRARYADTPGGRADRVASSVHKMTDPYGKNFGRPQNERT